MLKKIKKKGQAFIEFCMCVPIIIMLVIGLYDVCAINAMRIELQGFSQRAVNAYSINKNWTVGGITTEAVNMATQQTVFCLQGNGGAKTPNCSKPKTVKFKLLTPDLPNGQWAAGNVVCVKGIIEDYKPLYAQLFTKREINIVATACSSVEYSGPMNRSGLSRDNWEHL